MSASEQVPDAKSQGTIRNTLVDMREPEAGIYISERAGGITITRCDLTVDGGYAILAQEPVQTSGSGITVENITVGGEATTGTAISLMGRPQSEVLNSCIEVQGERSAIQAETGSTVRGNSDGGCTSARGKLGETSNPNTGTENPKGNPTVEKVQAGNTKEFQTPLVNTVIDISAQGADCSIVSQGNNWEIRDVGIKGSFSSDSPSKKLNLSRSGTIDNLYVPPISDSSLSIGNCSLSGGDQDEVTVKNSYFGRTGIDNFDATEFSGTLRLDSCFFGASGGGILTVNGEGTSMNRITIRADKASSEDTQGLVIQGPGQASAQACDIYCQGPRVTHAILTYVGSLDLSESQVTGVIQGNVNQTNVGENASGDPKNGVPTSFNNT